MTDKMKQAALRLGVKPADPNVGPTTKELAQALCDRVNPPRSQTRAEIAREIGVASEHTVQAWIERFTTSARKPR